MQARQTHSTHNDVKAISHNNKEKKTVNHTKWASWQYMYWYVRIHINIGKQQAYIRQKYNAHAAIQGIKILRKTSGIHVFNRKTACNSNKLYCKASGYIKLNNIPGSFIPDFSLFLLTDKKLTQSTCTVHESWSARIWCSTLRTSPFNNRLQTKHTMQPSKHSEQHLLGDRELKLTFMVWH